MQRCKRTPTIQINQPFNGPMMIYALQLRKQALNSHHEAVTARTAARRLEAAGWFKHQHPFIFWGQRQRAGRSLALIVAAENPPTDRIKKWVYENFGQNWKKKNANLAAVRRTKSSDICCHLHMEYPVNPSDSVRIYLEISR